MRDGTIERIRQRAIEARAAGGLNKDSRDLPDPEGHEAYLKATMGKALTRQHIFDIYEERVQQQEGRIEELGKAREIQAQRIATLERGLQGRLDDLRIAREQQIQSELRAEALLKVLSVLMDGENDVEAQRIQQTYEDEWQWQYESSIRGTSD